MPILCTVAPTFREVVVMTTCNVCERKRGFWGFLFGGWQRCQSCWVDYCGKCFGELKPAPGSTAEWTEGRECKKCKASIHVRTPLDYGHWP